jgi:hypothetical protein
LLAFDQNNSYSQFAHTGSQGNPSVAEVVALAVTVVTGERSWKAKALVLVRWTSVVASPNSFLSFAVWGLQQRSRST